MKAIPEASDFEASTHDVIADDTRGNQTEEKPDHHLLLSRFDRYASLIVIRCAS